MPDRVASSKFTVVTMYAWKVSVMAVLAGYSSGDWKSAFSKLPSPENPTPFLGEEINTDNLL
jgi:hypothetical protein